MTDARPVTCGVHGPTTFPCRRCAADARWRVLAVLGGLAAACVVQWWSITGGT